MLDKRTALAWLWRARLTIDATRWLLLGVGLAVFGLTDAIVDLPSGLSLVVAGASAALVGVDVTRFRRERSETQFRSRDGDEYDDVREALVGQDRFMFWTLRTGHFVWDRTASARLADEQHVVEMGGVDYVAPIQIAVVGRLFQRRKVAGALHAYNAAVVGLDTDLGAGDAVPTKIVVRRSRYWDYLASDGLAAQDTVIQGRDRPDLGRSLFIDRHGWPRDFASSWLLNAVGVSVFAITTDGRFVITSQSDRNDSSKGMFAPAGSGSLEPQDFRGDPRPSFVSLCTNGALRELAEETSIEESAVTSCSLLGVGRWLDKAAKPEVCLLAFLEIDSHEVARRAIPRSDRAYTLGVGTERFARSVDFWGDDTVSIASERVRRAMSVPLEASLLMLRAAVAASPALRSEVDGRVGRP